MNRPLTGAAVPARIRAPHVSALAASAALALLLVAAPGRAETFPSHTVRLVSPFPAGSGPDAVSRLLGERLGKEWGQPVIVDPRPGGNGFIAMEAGKRAPATGHELVVADVGHLAINPGLFKKLPYDPRRDFVPVTGLYRAAFFIVVSQQSSLRSIPDLIAAAKKAPDAVTYGSWAVGSTGHLGAAQLEVATGTQMLHAPYKDTSQLYTAVANGEVTWALGTYATAGPLIQAGKLRVLAVADSVRSPVLPNVPTVAEAGGPAGLEASSWVALLAPAGTPPATVSAIGKAVRTVLGEPDVKAKLATFGFTPAPGSSEDVSAWVARDSQRYAELIKRTGATIN
ncbi:exported protein [Cupriavidus sp. TA19]|uniref:Bug family tripartite tricarboxylate transporter substrate binding protein n=1 Tax=unclassified Cupriavidus TaxID=2640874 RepID=UPI000E2F8BED|nr:MULTISPECIES: tripartite tricarboxylate transporter substrate binding protein [unclassified Cupriavidus]BDB28681.1 tripartite tricarboxylate transporter substrate binding protein [Cupriavidus sp. P-10]GLC94345.1 exported protein [Cupriavidus sp. TA19]